MYQIDILDISPKGKKMVIASYLIRSARHCLLVDCGPESQFSNLEKQLAKYDLTPSDITDVLLTHIHLDHAGGAWRLAKLGANIYVHPFGLKHLLDPTQLVQSATMIYKDRMDDLWGKIEPIEQDKLKPVNDNFEMQLEDITFKAFFTPGHARHHIAWMLESNIFAGDVAGCRFPSGKITAPTPPPDLNFIEWHNSLDLILQQKPKSLYLTHFGRFDDIKEHIQSLRKNLDFSEKMSKSIVFDQKITPKEASAEIISNQLNFLKLSSEESDAFEAISAGSMNASGLIHFWSKVKAEKTK